jgi:hypothetical protein
MLFSFCLGQSQNVIEDSATINLQFKNLIEKSSSYQEYKVINKQDIEHLRINVIHTIDNFNDTIVSLKNIISAHKSKIDLLEKDLSNVNESLMITEKERDHISFFGISTSKVFYNSVLWILILLLFVLVIFMSQKFKNSNLLVKEAKRELQVIEEELVLSKRRSLEKIQSMGRQLIDERNKLAKLKKEKP